ncbi:hypothetical protein FD754_018609 [Muntiacus muntjak]|uniref:DNA polymerase II subunit 2 n=1 Tax=Muntiacus muntjak TaxID=9888 RepID=A0A5N3UXW9_MUNMU|nr:hypothetical protein FD754_018609 [Muntiacus muntjak]
MGPEDIYSLLPPSSTQCCQMALPKVQHPSYKGISWLVEKVQLCQARLEPAELRVPPLGRVHALCPGCYESLTESSAFLFMAHIFSIVSKKSLPIQVFRIQFLSIQSCRPHPAPWEMLLALLGEGTWSLVALQHVGTLPDQGSNLSGTIRNSLVVQWLALGTFTSLAPGSILGQGTKILQTFLVSPWSIIAVVLVLSFHTGLKITLPNERAYYGNINFFGGPSNTSVKTSAKLKQLEDENKDAMFVFISDVWLDQVEVLEKLHIMFSGYSPAPPTCFILCGNFSSAPYGKNQVQALKDSLKTLADIICEYPNIHQSSRFVFVPGPEDPGFGSILPRPPFAESITNEFRQRVPFSVFTTNPCRIQYCTQEIIVFREDLVNKMCRNCVRFPSSNLDIPNHFVKTVLSQGHLTPLPLYVCPVYWAYDYALRVYPVPDLLVIADKYDPFTLTNTECLCINPLPQPQNYQHFEPDNSVLGHYVLKVCQGF